MARFQSGASVDETSSAAAGRTKQALHPTLSGPAVQKKPVLESLSGSAINVPTKPSFLKNTPSTKSDTDAHEPSITKALANRFANAPDDNNAIKPMSNFKQQAPLKSPFLHTTEAKVPAQKPPFNKPLLSSTLSESKPVFPKPPATSKPNWVKEDSGGGTGINSVPTPPKVPGLEKKPSSSFVKLRHQSETVAGPETLNKPTPPPNAPVKPVSNFRTTHNMFNKDKDTSEKTDSGWANKAPLTATDSFPPPKPLVSKPPSLKKPNTSAKTSGIKDDPTPAPKRNPLPNNLALGAAPAKPNRPPHVNLENFKRTSETSDDGKFYCQFICVESDTKETVKQSK